ncbi:MULTISPECIES: hypothetical protein [Aminobacterium]|jgi:hypothetical protein|uniref:hypothetical protein n=1 Tax=Aminobacterium TaxID=81466 RepID=UPI001BCDD768|nr:hypothetical protein [Aminobacterium sp. UBA4987]
MNKKPLPILFRERREQPAKKAASSSIIIDYLTKHLASFGRGMGYDLKNIA